MCRSYVCVCVCVRFACVSMSVCVCPLYYIWPDLIYRRALTVDRRKWSVIRSIVTQNDTGCQCCNLEGESPVQGCREGGLRYRHGKVLDLRDNVCGVMVLFKA